MSEINNLMKRHPELSVCETAIISAYKLLVRCFSSGHRLYVCGNGGSAADALHITGELMKSFAMKRRLDDEFIKQANDTFPIEAEQLINNLQGALPVYALVENVVFSSAYANDVDADYIFAQQIYCYARQGDVVFGISTSGNSINVINALMTAKARCAVTLGLTGMSGGRMAAFCDNCICVPETETYKVQELHMPVYHTLCRMLENHFWGDEK